VVFTGLVARRAAGYLASSDACLVRFRRTSSSHHPAGKFFEDAAMERPILLGFEGDAGDAGRRTAASPSGSNDEALGGDRDSPHPPRAAAARQTAAATSSSTSTAARSPRLPRDPRARARRLPARPPVSARRLAAGRSRPRPAPACGRMARSSHRPRRSA
jgi:hypothetical protein